MPERFEGGCLSPNAGIENPMLVMSNFRPEPHVAQQSRRDKLRVQHTSTSSNPIQDFQSSMLNSVADPDQIPVRSVRNYDIVYDPSTAIFSSEMLNFSSTAANAGGGPSSIDNNLTNHSSSVPATCSFDGDPHNPRSYWKGLSSSQTHGGDWMVSYGSGNPGPLFVGGVKEGNISSSSPSCMKPLSYSHLHNIHSSMNNPSSADLSSQEGNSQKHYGELHYNPTAFYQNALPDVVPSSSSSSGFEMAGQGPWVDSGNELLLLPSFGNQATTPLRLGNVAATAWMNRPAAGAAEGSQQWASEDGFVADKREAVGFGAVGRDNTTAQGLSLSLSSHSPSDFRVAQLEGVPPRAASGNFQPPQDSKGSCLGGFYCSYTKSPVGSMSRSFGSSLQSIVGSSDIRRGAGPLGPFTGYATILKNSKFLKPAQQLLDEFCSVMGPKAAGKTSEASDQKGSNASMSCDTATNAEHEVGGRGGNSGVSTCSFYSSTEGGSGSGSGGGEGGNGACQPFRPEFHRKKAKLLYMQEEVCRRYKQYHQQMQMVLSSFESVAGLSSATPFASVGLKAVSKHFRCLRNAISDQLKNISRALGEEFMSASTSKSDALPRLRFIEQSFRKPKAGENLGFLDHQPHVWRPQRGLPERSVAVLKAWLFEHFLHPYPTDTDKHMLATQTGLSRNQVSNWFINARVRLWKPMVEEIHMLEAKGSGDVDLNSVKRDGKHSAENVERPHDHQQRSKLTIESAFNKQSEQSVAGPASNIVESRNSEQWHQEKRSRMDGCQMATSVNGGLMGFLPYQGGIEIGGLGAVSLTLGLRHSAESLHQQQQQQQQQLRHFGAHNVHDFAG